MSRSADPAAVPPRRRRWWATTRTTTTALGLLLVLHGLPDCAGRTAGARQQGFAIPTWERDGYADPLLGRDLDQVLAAGADWVQFVPTVYQPDVHSAQIAVTEQTTSDAGLENAVRLAHRAGLRVLLKPAVDVTSAPGSQALISPTDRDRWFARYTDLLTHYARLASRLQVEQLAVGTELVRLSGDRSAWLALIRQVRRHYDGPLVYAANFNEYRRVSFWDAVDIIGIDAYWSLARQPTRDVEALQRGWRPIRDQLATFAAQHRRRVLFTEAGYTSARGTTTRPWSWTVSQVPDQDEQAAAYRALLTTFADEPWWAGVYWWVWAAPPDRGGGPLDFSPRGKAAEQVVRQWWAGQVRSQRTLPHRTLPQRTLPQRRR